MTEPIDLDALERSIAVNGPRMGRGGWIAAIRPLIAELRAARKVVAAAREVPVAAAWLMAGLADYEQIHAGVQAVFETLSAALADYEALK